MERGKGALRLSERQEKALYDFVLAYLKKTYPSKDSQYGVNVMWAAKSLDIAPPTLFGYLRGARMGLTIYRLLDQAGKSLQDVVGGPPAFSVRHKGEPTPNMTIAAEAAAKLGISQEAIEEVLNTPHEGKPDRAPFEWMSMMQKRHEARNK